MKRLTAIVVIAASLWAGYWFMGATGLKRGLEAWLQERRAAGWQADVADLTVMGFPNRFDTTFGEFVLADPNSGWAWQVPFFQLLALSYRPNHVIAVWPNSQTLATPLQKLQISSASMQASLRLGSSTDLPLERANLVADTLLITDEAGESTAMTALRMAVERVEGHAARYHFGFAAEDLEPAKSARLALDMGGNLPPRFSNFSADITADFTQAWDRAALESRRPQPVMVDIAAINAQWGQMELAMAGQLQIDAAGVPTGQVVIKARNWRDILAMAVASGAVPQALARQAEQGLQMLAQMSGDPNTLDLPIDFRAGLIMVGGVLPLGPAPKLQLR